MDELNIEQYITDGFTEATEQYLMSLNLYQLFQELIIIRNRIQDNMTKSTNLLVKTRRGYDLRDEIIDTQEVQLEKKLLFTAYEIIQLIRSKITNQTLNYRLFITAEGEVPLAQYVDIHSGAKLYELLSLNNKEISILANRVNNEIQQLKSNEINTSARDWFNEKYRAVLSQFEHPDTGKNKQSFFVIIKQHGMPSPPHRRFDKDGSPIVYTRGHIIEALNTVYFKTYELEEYKKDENILKTFGQELGYDKVTGFKGGDSGMTQVKANSARLMRYSTIMNAIDKALQIYDLIANPGKRGLAMGKIRQRIKVLYSDSKGKNSVNQVSNEMIEQFVNKLLDQIPKTV